MSLQQQGMVVTSQVEEYLEAICRIGDRQALVTLTELARELSVAPPSALGMVHRMEEQGLLSYSKHTGAMLTELGTTCAMRLRRRHRLAERMLTDLLGMPWARAHDVACRFEHIIDDEVEAYLETALQHPTTCPHGNPLDGSAGNTLNWRSLDTLALGQRGIVRCIIDESASTLDYLEEIHLHPGTVVILRACAPLNGPLTIEILEQRYAMSREMARHLLVEEGAGDE